jgi:D-beta-D-heptose 7-phosphate kinase/D-beta-D-heptose 1-phosphate adenosyltransferase
MTARDKILNAEDLQNLCRSLQRKGGRIVFTNGCFDLIHVGHLRYLEAARALGDHLVVGVNSDASVHEIKGTLRPITVENERAEMVAALHCVDYVTVFATPDPLPLIRLVRPDVLVKGADWSMDRIVGASDVLAWGGEVARIPLVPESSTTLIIERILTRFGAKDRISV